MYTLSHVTKIVIYSFTLMIVKTPGLPDIVYSVVFGCH